MANLCILRPRLLHRNPINKPNIPRPVMPHIIGNRATFTFPDQKNIRLRKVSAGSGKEETRIHIGIPSFGRYKILTGDQLSVNGAITQFQ